MFLPNKLALVCFAAIPRKCVHNFLRLQLIVYAEESLRDMLG